MGLLNLCNCPEKFTKQCLCVKINKVQVLSKDREGNGNPLQCSCLENPRDGEPGGLPSMGSHRVGHDWSDLAAAAAALNRTWRQEWLGGVKETSSSSSGSIRDDDELLMLTGNQSSWLWNNPRGRMAHVPWPQAPHAEMTGTQTLLAWEGWGCPAAAETYQQK